MKKILFTLALSLAFFGTAKAVVLQHVTLKNGSKLNGYVQQAANGRLTFHSENATIIIDNADVETPEQNVIEGRLDAAWVRWAERHEAFENNGTGRSLTLNNVVFRDNMIAKDSAAKGGSLKFNDFLKQKRTINNVKVLEQGINVTYLELTPNVYTLTWDDIAQIRIDKRAKTALSGIDCTYQLRTGETFEGQQAGETKNSLSLYLDNGVVQSLDIDDVIKYTFRPINPNQDIFAQSELIDIVKTNNGGEVRGIIIEQNYASKKDSENYILVQQESGAIQSIKISEVKETLKEENPKFSPLFDIILNPGQVLVNRQDFRFVNVKEDNDVMVLDSLLRANVISHGPGEVPVTVEYHADNGSNIEQFQLVRVTRKDVKRKASTFSFSYKDLVNAVYRPKAVTTSINQTTKAEYMVGSPGIYALYDAKQHRAIPIVVK